MSAEKLIEISEQLNNLQKKLAECLDDKEAINIQSEIVEILSETFSDEELMTNLLLASMENKR